MKIGIFTLPLHENYGGIVQAYALQKVIRDLGHDVETINEEYHDAPLPLYRVVGRFVKGVLRWIIRRFQGRSCYILYDEKLKELRPLLWENPQKFVKENIALSRKVKSPSEIKENEYDCILVGSDQIWRPKFYWNVEDAQLYFTKSWKNVKRMTYAVSFGSDIWEYKGKDYQIIKEMLPLYEALSFRETSGVEMCYQHFGLESLQHIDPTMLLQKDDYIKLLKKSNMPKSEGNLFYYVLDETIEKRNMAYTISKMKGLKMFEIMPSKKNEYFLIEDRKVKPVEAWLRSFYDADYVVTDSFHGCVFSILFEKQFVVYGNKKRGLSRFETLLKTFHLEDRLISSIDDLSHISGTIDYSAVNIILESKRKEAFSYLTLHLNSL